MERTRNLEKPAEPGAYEQAMAKCTPIARSWDNRFQQELATYMKVSLGEMPAAFCDRVLRGIESGRIKREDFVNADRGSVSQLFAAIKGR